MMTSASSVSLTSLLDGIATPPVPVAVPDAEVSDLAIDSREVRAGSLFLALPGHRSHGLNFAADALARGARVLLWDPAGLPPGYPTPTVRASAAYSTVLLAPVTGLAQMVGRIADRFFGRPSLHLRVVGITGTNGKTTCAYLLAQCLDRLQSVAAYTGTIGWGRIGALEPAGGSRDAHTTPDVVSVHRRLSKLRALGVRDVAMEVSSHALDQGRVDGVRWHSAAFTNLTRDHLDYHPSMAAYGAAKARLFDAAELEHLAINVGDAFGGELARRHSGRVPLTAVWVGEAGVGWPAGSLVAAGWPGTGGHAHRTLQATHVVPGLDGLCMELTEGAASAAKRRLTTRLFGRFNAENAVIVIACLLGLGVPLDAAAAALAECTAPPGRMEVIEAAAPGKPLAVVDYAHTPDALGKALRALREHCRGTLWCVFGCGGDRDPGKRPLMGRVADELADRIILTDDNPRSENPQDIVRAIADGIRAHPVRIIHDRGAAIAAALNDAGTGDAVLIAGKGHEDYQFYGTVRRSFSDRYEAQRHLGARTIPERP